MKLPPNLPIFTYRSRIVNTKVRAKSAPQLSPKKKTLLPLAPIVTIPTGHLSHPQPTCRQQSNQQQKKIQHRHGRGQINRNRTATEHEQNWGDRRRAVLAPRPELNSRPEPARRRTQLAPRCDVTGRSGRPRAA